MDLASVPERCGLAALLSAAILLVGCGQSADPTVVASTAGDSVALCSNMGGEAALRIAACTTVIQSSDATPLTRSIAANNRGVIWMGQGNRDSAIADYDAAIRTKPDYAPAYYNRSRAWRAKGDNMRADADSAEAARLDPNLQGR
jgi:tetratricopeptide (TPR) repeat protein